MNNFNFSKGEKIVCVNSNIIVNVQDGECGYGEWGECSNLIVGKTYTSKGLEKDSYGIEYVYVEFVTEKGDNLISSFYSSRFVSLDDYRKSIIDDILK